MSARSKKVFELPIWAHVVLLVAAVGLSGGIMWALVGPEKPPEERLSLPSTPGMVGDLGKVLEKAEELNEALLATVQRFGSMEIATPYCDGARLNSTVGIAHDIRFKDSLLYRARAPICTYCSGAMFELYMTVVDQVMKERGLEGFGMLSPTTVEDFRKSFYGVTGDERTLVTALTRFGLGIEVPRLEDAKPGDFIQFWWNRGTGHAAILTDLYRGAQGNVTGFEYWSSQSGTEGWGRMRESLGSDTSVNLGRIYLVRAVVPEIPRSMTDDMEARYAERKKAEHAAAERARMSRFNSAQAQGSWMIMTLRWAGAVALSIGLVGIALRRVLKK